MQQGLWRGLCMPTLLRGLRYTICGNVGLAKNRRRKRPFICRECNMARVRCCCSCGFLSLLVLVMGADSGPPSTPSLASVPTDAIQSLEAAMRLTAEAQQAYKGVSDYTCLF